MPTNFDRKEIEMWDKCRNAIGDFVSYSMFLIRLRLPDVLDCSDTSDP